MIIVVKNHPSTKLFDLQKCVRVGKALVLSTSVKKQGKGASFQQHLKSISLDSIAPSILCNLRLYFEFDQTYFDQITMITLLGLAS